MGEVESCYFLLCSRTFLQWLYFHFNAVISLINTAGDYSFLFEFVYLLDFSLKYSLLAVKYSSLKRFFSVSLFFIKKKLTSSFSFPPFSHSLLFPSWGNCRKKRANQLFHTSRVSFFFKLIKWLTELVD